MSQTLTLEIAQILVALANEDQNPQIDASEYTAITHAAAEALAMHEGVYLFLNGLTSLSYTAAKALAEYDCYLQLDDLTNLSDAAAKALAKHDGKVHFAALPEKDHWLYSINRTDRRW
jgi:hypothetical protein